MVLIHGAKIGISAVKSSLLPLFYADFRTFALFHALRLELIFPSALAFCNEFVVVQFLYF